MKDEIIIKKITPSIDALISAIDQATAKHKGEDVLAEMLSDALKEIRNIISEVKL